MKKTILKGVAILGAIAMFSSCAVSKSPITAFVYTDVKAPELVTGNSGSSKVGTAQASGILGIVTTGDASIEAAAKSAGITKVHHVDYHSTNILGVYATYTVFVYGE